MQNELKKELGTNFIEYAVAVNTDRAIPDAKSGLKPVAKRILYGAFATGRVSNKPHVKCARIVGDVMGSYHPHGDSSIYGALVRLAQNWVMRYPLIDFHGNLGNIDGDGPAAYRYTEARLSKLTEEGLLTGIKKKCVDFIPNYDETTEEPITLPAIFPNLLCNPNSGIGVAMACNWLPHNLKEVAQAIYDYMDGKEPMLPGPDFPTGGIIINKNDLPNILKTGHGSVKVRGRYKLEKNTIVFYEIPYGTSTEALIAEIGQVADSKEIEGITNIRNESNKKNGMRIVIEHAKDANAEVIVRKLFAKTKLQTSISYNQVALVDKTPTELGLEDCIKIYIEHNEDCLIKETNFDLKKAQDRMEILNGLLKALEDIDNIIALIKGSASAAAAKDNLIAKYAFTEPQAKAIVDMKLGKIAGLEKIELQNEQSDLSKAIERYKNILESQKTRMEIIRERLAAIVKKFGDERKTELLHLDIKPEEKEIAEVVPEDCVVIVTKAGAIKRVPVKSFKIQRKNGKGVKSEDDTILDTISTNTIDTLMIFTNKGKMYKLLVDNVPVGTNASKGVNLNSLVNFDPDEYIIAINSLYRKTNAEYVVFMTKNGLLKKTALEEYTKMKKSTGIAAIKIKEGDSLANVMFLKDEDIIIVTEQGLSIHIETKTVNAIGRVTSGVKAIKLNDGDLVLHALPIHSEKDEVAIFTKDGYGKKVGLEEFPLQGRGGKGIIISKSEVAGVAMLSEDDLVLLLGRPNSICINAADVPSLSRTSVGNMMIKGSSLVSVVKI